VNRIRLTLVCVLAAALFSGCTIRPEGVFIKKTMSEEKWQRVDNQLIENKKAAKSNPDTVNLDQSPGSIAIGEVGPYRSFNNPRTFRKAYKEYVKNMTDAGQTEQILSEQELRDMADGWTTIRVLSIPLVGIKSINALVKKGESENIGFSTTIGTILFATREDLVVASSSIEKPYWVIHKSLCRGGKAYYGCYKKYDRGLYDIFTGRELNSKMEIKPKGVLIDLTTYEKISK